MIYNVLLESASEIREIKQGYGRTKAKRTSLLVNTLKLNKRRMKLPMKTCTEGVPQQSNEP